MKPHTCLVLYRKPVVGVLWRHILNLRPHDSLIYLGDRRYADTLRSTPEFSEVHLFENYFEHNLYWESIARAICQNRQVSFIIPIGEMDILPAARLRQEFSIPGPLPDDVLNFRDKVRMKHLASQKGLSTPYFSAVNSIVDLDNFVCNHGFPFVLKPVGRACSEGVVFVNSELELQKLRESLSRLAPNIVDPGFACEWEVEELIAGEIYHVDGYARNGGLELCWPSRYINSNYLLREGVWCGSVLLDHNDRYWQALCEYTERLLVSLGATTTVFHAELFVRQNTDEVVLCEIACRVGGAMINSYIQMAFGTDLRKVHIRIQANLPVLDEDKPKSAALATAGWRTVRPHSFFGTLAFPVRAKHIFVSGPASCPLPFVREYNLVATPGCAYEASGLNEGLCVTAICSGENELEVHRNIVTLASWIEQHCEWRAA